MRRRVPHFRRFRIVRALIAGALSACAGAAQADDYGDPSGRTLTAALDMRLVGVDGERSWIDGGFGKSRFGRDAADHAGDFHVTPRIVEGDLVWQPQISWSLSGTFAVTAQSGQDHAIDLSEAYLFYRHDPIGGLKLSARAGLFWPPVSLEHSGPEWQVTQTITPSAINSWIGEEVKLGGAEATASLPLGAGRIAGTLGIFGFNDTAGTLLAFRGWALHDEKAVAFGRQPLPPLDDFMQYAQAERTRPVIEIDDKPGFYGKIAWSPIPAAKISAFYYDNRGDPEAVTNTLQWGWRTRFTDLGGTWQIGARTKLTSQAMIGNTRMGYPMAGRIWVDTDFRSAFLLATREIGLGSVSGRIEAFGTDGHGSVLAGGSSEDGWAATLAARRPIGGHAAVLAEVLHVESDRDERLRDDLAPRQTQTVVQIAVRLRM